MTEKEVKEEGIMGKLNGQNKAIGEARKERGYKDKNT